MFSKEELKKIEPKSDFFVGIDSDGCVFDTMEVKQRKCFHPEIIAHWGLESVADQVVEVASFVSLYSSRRGRNRFPALVDVMDFLRTHPEISGKGITVPELNALKAWIARESRLGNAMLRQEVERSGDAELADILVWSEAVDIRIEKEAVGIAPFEGVREALELITADADCIVVSQTPGPTIAREWEENGITGYVSFIAAQETGTKTEHLEIAAKGRYESERILMIGDAPGDLDAAVANGALFFPIVPGKEVESWLLFNTEAYARFIAGTYSGAYQDDLIAGFKATLPDLPPWQES